MGRDEVVATQKSEKSASTKDQATIYPYPDWSAMQACYGHGMVPQPYFGSAIAPGYAPPPYMWGPQPLVPPFGTPYPGMYPHGGAGYTHPVVPMMAKHLKMESAAKSVDSKEKSSNKKLKELNGTAMSTGSSNSEKTSSGDNNGEGSGDGNNQPRVTKRLKKRNSMNGPELGDESLKLSSGCTAAPADMMGNPAVPLPSCIQAQEMNPAVASSSNVKAIGMPISPSTGTLVPCCNGVAHESWKDERELKRERRKQSNRESARRSRLRRQAETEELAIKVESLTAENTTLKSELSRLTESSEKLRLENSSLMEKLKEPSEMDKSSLDKIVDTASSVVVENFLSMIDNPNATSRSGRIEHSEPKLHQLLSSSPATDALAAS